MCDKKKYNILEHVDFTTKTVFMVEFRQIINDIIHSNCVNFFLFAFYYYLFYSKLSLHIQIIIFQQIGNNLSFADYRTPNYPLYFLLLNMINAFYR